MELILKPIFSPDVYSLKLVPRSAIYGLKIIVGLVGLWYEKVWSKILFIGLVGVPLPIEGQELIHDFSQTRLAIFILNLVVFIFLIIQEFKAKD